MKGFEARVGQRIKRDTAISIDVMVWINKHVHDEWNQAQADHDIQSMFRVAEWGAYFSLTFAHSLRGWETVKAVYSQTKEQMELPVLGVHGDTGHVGLALVGRFKRCGNQSVKLLCLISGETASGLQPLLWTQRLMTCLEQRGLKSDWLFQLEDGKRKGMSSFYEPFYEYLEDCQRERPDLISPDMVVTEDYFLGISFRRGATTRAQAAGVPEATVDWINRWGSAEEQVVRGPMRVIYAERKLLKNTFLAFSAAL